MNLPDPKDPKVQRMAQTEHVIDGVTYAMIESAVQQGSASSEPQTWSEAIAEVARLLGIKVIVNPKTTGVKATEMIIDDPWVQAAPASREPKRPKR